MEKLEYLIEAMECGADPGIFLMNGVFCFRNDKDKLKFLHMTHQTTCKFKEENILVHDIIPVQFTFNNK